MVDPLQYLKTLQPYLPSPLPEKILPILSKIIIPQKLQNNFLTYIHQLLQNPQSSHDIETLGPILFPIDNIKKTQILIILLQEIYLKQYSETFLDSIIQNIDQEICYDMILRNSMKFEVGKNIIAKVHKKIGSEYLFIYLNTILMSEIEVQSDVLDLILSYIQKQVNWLKGEEGSFKYIITTRLYIKFLIGFQKGFELINVFLEETKFPKLIYIQFDAYQLLLASQKVMNSIIKLDMLLLFMAPLNFRFIQSEFPFNDQMHRIISKNITDFENIYFDNEAFLKLRGPIQQYS